MRRMGSSRVLPDPRRFIEHKFGNLSAGSAAAADEFDMQPPRRFSPRSKVQGPRSDGNFGLWTLDFGPRNFPLHVRPTRLAAEALGTHQHGERAAAFRTS